MANAPGTLSTGILAAVALSLMQRNPMLSLFATDLNQLEKLVATAGKDETIKVKIPTIPAVADFGSAATDFGTTELDVVLSYFRQVYHEFTAAELQACNTYETDAAARLLISNRAEKMATALARDVVNKLLARYTTANGYDAMTAAAQGDMDYDYFLTARETLNTDTRYCPDSGRWAMVNSATYKVLAADDRVIKTNKPSGGSDAVDTGIIENVAGFRVVEVAFLNTANATANLTAIFGTPSSGIYASRLPRDPSELFPGAPKNSLNEPIVDKITGHSLMHQEAVDNFALTAKIRDLHLFGTAKGIVGHAILGIKS